MNKFIYYTFLFCSIAIISCKKSDDNKDTRTVVGTWKAYQYIYTETGAAPVSVHLQSSELATDVLQLNADGTGKITSSGNVVATFKYTFTGQEASNMFLTFSDFTLSNPDNVDPLFQYMGNYNYVVNEYASNALGFYIVLNSSINGQADSKEFIYEFTKM